MLLVGGENTVFNGHTGRVFQGLRPAEGCCGVEMGLGLPFSGSLR